MKQRPVPNLLTDTLCHPGYAGSLDLRNWEQLIWQARAAELIAQLHGKLSDAGVLHLAPPAARRHLCLAWQIAKRHAEAVHAELDDLWQSLAQLGIPVLLLKGAAYSALNHPAASGRIFNDIDILVPKTALADVEVRLGWAGWLPSHTNAYDERYYRQWMHEIPPLEHKNRATVLDVHHTILPPTSGIRPDPSELMTASHAVIGRHSFFRVLAPCDMVIHSACHLFFGEFHKGLRDLFDLHQLLTDFGQSPGFWPQLAERALQLELGLPVLDALEQCQRLYGTAVDRQVVVLLQARCASRWPGFARRWMFEHALRPAHDSAWTRGSRIAQALVFVRSHWLRMPLPLLTYHIVHKLTSPR